MPITTLTMKTDILNAFFQATDFDTDKRAYLENALSKLCKNKSFINVCESYQYGLLTKEQFCDAYPEIAKNTEIHEYTVALLLLICFTDRLQELYKQNGIAEDIYFATIQDLKYKAQEGAMVKGVCGTFCADWLFKYFELGRFTLGRLQCEVVPFGNDYKYLVPTSPCLKVHIPRSGEPLTPESIDASIAFAKEFFKDKLSDPTPVICSSYLLYEDFQTVYKEGSNLSKFCKRFELVTNTQDVTDDYPNLWRVFDMDYTGNVDDYPENSSLHKNIKEYLKNGGKTGLALGVFFA